MPQVLHLLLREADEITDDAVSYHQVQPVAINTQLSQHIVHLCQYLFLLLLFRIVTPNNAQ